MIFGEASDNNTIDTPIEDHTDEHERRLSFTLANHQDHVLIVTMNDVTITSTSEPLKTITFTANRWAHFVAAVADIDDEAKELNRKTRPVAYRLHIGDGYYISVTGGIHCIDFRKFYVPYGLSYDQARPSKNGLSLRLDKWVHLMQVIPTVHVTFPDLANAKRCIDENNYLSQRGWLQCISCFPFGH